MSKYLPFFMNTSGEIERIDFIMPKRLEGVFSVTLFLKNAISDIADGDQEILWKKISKHFNNKKLVAPQQVHGIDIIEAKSFNALPLRPEADGIFIEEKNGCCFSLQFADCTPIVIAGTDPLPWMFFLHSGFWGTVKGITNASFVFLRKKYNNFTVRDNTWAWIGPSICEKCYSRNIEDEMTVKALDQFDADNMLRVDNQIYFDITKQIKKQLVNNGLKESNIYVFEECTRCNNNRYYSYRAGDKKRRQFLLGNCAIN